MDDIPAARRLGDPTALCGAAQSGPTVYQTGELESNSCVIHAYFALLLPFLLPHLPKPRPADCRGPADFDRADRRQSTPRGPIERVTARSAPHQLSISPRNGVRCADGPVHQERSAALPLHAAIPFCGHSRQIRARLRFLRHVCALGVNCDSR